MEIKRVMVTGGAGFIGQHLCKRLVEMGIEVLSFDCLVQQVHPESYERAGGPHWPAEQAGVEGIRTWFGDVSQPQAVISAMFSFRPDAIVHLAALVGVGQGNVMIAPYVSKNVTGTAVVADCAVRYNDSIAERRTLPTLRDCRTAVDEAIADLTARRDGLSDRPLDEVFDPEHPVDEDGNPFLVNDALADIEGTLLRVTRRGVEFADEIVRVEQLPETPIRAVIVAGSMSSYGEGAYAAADGSNRRVRGADRRADFLARGIFDALDEQDNGEGWEIVGVRETDDLRPASVYAWTKAAAEAIALQVSRARGLDVRVARFFNVYGRGQALRNPYTGIASIFTSRVLTGRNPIIYEDGGQLRDFVHVSDVVSGLVTILEHGRSGEVYNVGTGTPTSVIELAQQIIDEVELSSETGSPPVTTLDPSVEIAPTFPSPAVWRTGDVRHCYADARKLRALGWSPSVRLADGIADLIVWARSRPEWMAAPSTDGTAETELDAAGLLGRVGGAS